MDVPLIIWKGMSLLDLAMYANCERFIEECCASALDDLFTGDISPYGDRWITSKMTLCIMTGGLLIYFFPGMFQFNPPPRSSVVRTGAQRRKVPKGYPFQPRENEKLRTMYQAFLKSKSSGQRLENSEELPEVAEKKRKGRSRTFLEEDFEKTTEELVEIADSIRKAIRGGSGAPMEKKAMRWMHKLETDPNSAYQMTDEQLRQLWEPTFTFKERWKLFFGAPKVLYLCNIIVQIVVTVVFSILHFQLNTMVSTPELKGQIDKMEMLIILYFVSCILREFFQLLVSSTIAEYFTDVWNIIDITSIIGFALGTYLC